VRQIDVRRWKGKTNGGRTLECCGRGDATRHAPGIALALTVSSARSSGARRLRLRFQGQEIVVRRQSRDIAIGRAERNDLIIKGKPDSRCMRASNSAAQVPADRQSTNRNFVTTKEGEEPSFAATCS